MCPARSPLSAPLGVRIMIAVGSHLNFDGEKCSRIWLHVQGEGGELAGRIRRTDYSTAVLYCTLIFGLVTGSTMAYPRSEKFPAIL